MYRSEWQAKALNGRSVLGVALDVHMRITGSSEVGRREDLEQDVLLLVQIVESWKPTSHESGREFDTAVLNLILSAIKEARDSGLLTKEAINGSGNR